MLIYASKKLLLQIKFILNINRFFGIPEHILPEIKSSSTIFGYINQGPLKGIPVGAVRNTNLICIDFSY
jgi:glycerol kinase